MRESDSLPAYVFPFLVCFFLVSSTPPYHSLSFRPSPLENHLSCSSLARSLVSVISTIRLVLLLRTTLTFLFPFPPGFTFLLHRAWVGVSPSNVLCSQIK
ncbi:hypothetical protein DFH94DRAFT_288806 [Russula ochroleuca]|uniref:Uncharacterized protein n=1 Tax=Russula ochroleuca TaxID=152965 RepID=A0A9P5MQ93_9AGAM|nr:hypothetical protein DFH94DRAFT_288806 [Russula ochroleuca]